MTDEEISSMERELLALKLENDHLKSKIELFEANNINVHYSVDVLKQLYAAFNQIPCCGMLAIIGNAIQEIQHHRGM